MTPPKIGPRTLARMKTVETIPMYLLYPLGGTRPGAVTIIMEYMPEASIPWNARKTILCKTVSHEGAKT